MLTRSDRVGEAEIEYKEVNQHVLAFFCVLRECEILFI